jgi:DNA-directed RNA polymerase beta subunit
MSPSPNHNPKEAVAPLPSNDKACWDVIYSYFGQGGGSDCANVLVHHQIESYNEFIDKKLYQIIHGFNPIQICHQYRPECKDFTYKIFIKVQNPSLSKPVFQTQDGTQLPMTPHLARMNNLTYASQLTVDVLITSETINEDGVIEKKEAAVSKVNIGKVPIMVRSKACILNQLPGLGEGAGKHECRYDPGGYFIINGNEKVVVSQDRISENKTLVFAPNVSSGDGLTAEIRSMPDGVFLPPKICSLHLNPKPNHLGRVIRLSTTFLKSEIPLFVMFRALGIVSDEEILQHVVLDVNAPKNKRIIAELKACAEDASDIATQAEALAVLQRVLGITGTPREYLEQPEYALRILHQVIQADFLPHVGPFYRRKALYLGFMVRKLLKSYLGYIPYDNRDSYIHKRIDTPGILLSNLFRQCYGKLIKEMRNLIQRELHLWRAATINPFQVINQGNIHRFMKQTIIESGLRYALSTGNWGVKTLGSFQNIRQGVAQVLNRMSYLSTLSHLRRINTPMEKNGKLVQPRKLENTQFGMICPAETPEGGSVGLVKNMALSTRITTNTSSAYLRSSIEDLGTQVYSDHVADNKEYLLNMGSGDSVQVMVNGDIVGYHSRPAELYTTLKRMKRLGQISPLTSVIWDVPDSMIVLNTEAGRMCRPLLIVDEGNKLRLEKVIKESGGKAWSEFVKTKPFSSFLVSSTHEKDIEGFVEYMDVEEIDKSMLAMFPKDLAKESNVYTSHQLPERYTHCELHPSLINGVLGVNIPFSDHNQSPRNAYQCLWEEELVRMADGSSKMIKDVRVGDMVLTFHPETQYQSATKVVNQYVRKTDKTMYRIKTHSGRTIVATHDHPFLTNEGWKQVHELDQKHKLSICLDPKPMSPEVETYVVLDAPMMEARLLEHNVNPSLIAHHIAKLESMNFLPLLSTSKHIPVLARMAGYVLTDGSLNIYDKKPELQSTFGLPEDAQMFVDDIEQLGFNSVPVTCHTDNTFKVTHCVIASLFIALQVNMVPHIEVPHWITHGSQLTKREFLAGHETINININSLMSLMAEFKIDMKELDVENSSIYFFETIGYRYRGQKTVEAGKLVEFLKYKRLQLEDGKGEVVDKTWMMDVESKTHTILVPIASIEEVENCTISDITTESENHSFCAGDGFIVHNCAMGKQAVGIYMSNYNQRIDTMGHILNYAQKPLARTRLSKITNSDELPSGVNAVVAIMTYTGFNQEDSVMINRSALDRGLFSSTYYKSYKDQCSKNHSTGEEEQFSCPDPMITAHMKPFNYGKLAEDGFVPKNTFVDSNDIIVGKVMPHKVQGIIHPKDASMYMKATDTGHIDMNYQGTNGEGYKFCKVRLRKYRKPTVGDKVSSRHGQKGTIGMTYIHQDMPFSKAGITPDIIINPHAVPSRMTIGQLIECIMGKAACCLGTIGDATPFTDCTVEDIAQVLQKFGMERHGNEILYDGRSGRQIQTEIFIGPTFYQRLKHMVEDKMHTRGGNGPVVMLTRQPAEGRARNGGLRFGEMERDAIVAHGAGAFLKERMLDVSDNYRVFVCRKCGMLSVANPERNIYKCTYCKNSADITQARIPYSMKLLIQELMTMAVAPRIVI